MIDTTLQKYFWDVDPSTLDLALHKKYIIERILDLGDEMAISWLREIYTKEDIAAVIRSTRRLSPRSKNFWNVVLERL